MINHKKGESFHDSPSSYLENHIKLKQGFLAPIVADILGESLWCVRLVSGGIVTAGTAIANSARHSVNQDNSESGIGSNK